MNFQYIKIKHLLLIAVFCAAVVPSLAQVGIGRGSSPARGVLDVNNPSGANNTQGIVLPKTDNIAALTAPDGTAPVEGTAVFDTTDDCLKHVQADGTWSKCLLDSVGVREVVSSVLSIGSNFKIKTASIGLRHTLAIGKDDNAVYVAGSNANARTGLGRTSGNTSSFIVVFAFPVKSVSAGYDHSMAVDALGQVWGWGSNATYKTGLGITGNNSATAVPSLVNGFGAGETYGEAVKVETGQYNSFVLTNDGKVYSVGGNTNGSSGTGGALNSFTLLSTLPEISDISASQYTAAALTTDGKVYVWGYGDSGRLGNGGNTTSTTPTLITMPGASKVVKVVMGFQNGAAISLDRKHVYAWGYQYSLNISNANVTSPTEIIIPDFDPAVDTVVDIAVQRFSDGDGSLLIITNKGVYVTGENSSGQLGVGTTSDVRTGFKSISTTGVFLGTTFVGASIGAVNTLLFTDANANTPSVSYVAYGMGAVNNRALGAVTVEARTPVAITK